MEDRRTRVTLDNSALRTRTQYIAQQFDRRPVTVNNTPNHSDITVTAYPSKAVPPINRQDLDFRFTRENITKPSPTYLIESDLSRTESKSTEQEVAHQESPIGEMIAIIQANTEQKIVRPKKSMHTLLKRAAYTAVSCVAVIGIGVFVVQNNSSQPGSPAALAEKESSEQTSKEIAPVLDEEIIPQSEINAFTTSASSPRVIRIKKAGLDMARTLPLSTDSNGVLNMPKNIWDTGWYDGSAVPGAASGATLIIGHVSGPTRGGAFYNLYRLIVGDVIEIETGEGKVFTYQVVEKGEVPDGPIVLGDYMTSKQPDKQGLTLMASSGEYNPVTKETDKPLVVFAIRTN